MLIGNVQIYGVIYKITNLINFKVYIGQTMQEGGFDRRYGNNIYLNTHNKYLKRSIKKYGIENFEVSKIFDVAFSKEELDIKEVIYIEKYKHSNGIYNIAQGGSNGSTFEYMTEKDINNWKTKISNSHKGKKLPKEQRNKIGQSNMGKKRTKESKKKMSEKAIGNKANSGKIFTEDWKNKISKSHIGENNPMFGKYGQNNPTSKQVICMTTNKIFNSITEASEYYKCSITGITACCKNRRKHHGKLENGTKLTWMYYVDYVKQLNIEGERYENIQSF
jgi:group I intron endonuclease